MFIFVHFLLIFTDTDWYLFCLCISSCPDLQQDSHSSLDDPGYQSSGHFADSIGLSPEIS